VDSARAIMLTIPMTMAEMEAAVLETIAAMACARDISARRDSRKGNLGLSRTVPKASVIVIAATIHFTRRKPTSADDVVTVATRRMARRPEPAVKSLNYLNNIMAKHRANIAKADEGLMLNEEGYVPVHRRQRIRREARRKFSHRRSRQARCAGITWKAVLDIAAELGLKVNVQNLTRYDLYTADEFFLTGTRPKVIAAVKLDTA